LTGETPALEPGACLAPGYRVLESLRRGALLDVYDVWSIERRCRCVAKVLRPERAAEAGARRRLLREGRLLARLTHPHIVRAYEVLETPQPMVILETLTGATLGHLIHESPGRLGFADVALLGLHVCSAVHYLHAQGVLHLDLKPSNIVVEGGMAKVLDLDIARSPGSGRGEGTRQYMAPEQVKRQHLGPPTDVWGIGTILFEATTGRLPFDFNGDSQFPQLDQPAEPVSRFRRRLPLELAHVVDAALQRDPSDRPTVDDVARSLAPLVAGALPWPAV
jgi:eukaryotic-like serine/threonine-protein kinase